MPLTLRRRPRLLIVGEVQGQPTRSVQNDHLVSPGGQGRRDAGADGTGAADDHGHAADGLGHAPAADEIVACAARWDASSPAIRPNTMASVRPPPCSIRCPQARLTAPAA
jgi:hypothetical protein